MTINQTELRYACEVHTRQPAFVSDRSPAFASIT